MAIILLLAPFFAHAACREPIYIGRPAADEVTKRNYENCMKREEQKNADQSQQDLINKQRLQMQQIEQQQIQQLR